MGKILVVFLISLLSLNLIAGAPHSHDDEELTDQEMLILLQERDIMQDLEKIQTLYNSILSEDVLKDKKCAYITELDRSLVVLNFALNQYLSNITMMPSSQFSDSDFTNPNGVSVRQMKVYQIRDRMHVVEESSKIFSKNNGCI